jgi:hypothetical protein
MSRVFGAAAAEYLRMYRGGAEYLAKMGESLELNLKHGIWGVW